MYGVGNLKPTLVAFVAVLAIAGRTSSVSGHTYHTGSCPIVEPMAGFDMRQVSDRINTVFGNAYTIEMSFIGSV